jgi:hypothetical protein
MKVDATTSAIASGEAVVNDAVSIVVFESVLSLFYTHSNSQFVDFRSVPIEFIVVFFGSIVIGVAGGLVSALITKRLPLKMYCFSVDYANPIHKNTVPRFAVDRSSSPKPSSAGEEIDGEAGHDNRVYLEVCGVILLYKSAVPFLFKPVSRKLPCLFKFHSSICPFQIDALLQVGLFFITAYLP